MVHTINVLLGVLQGQLTPEVLLLKAAVAKSTAECRVVMDPCVPAVQTSAPPVK